MDSNSLFQLLAVLYGLAAGAAGALLLGRAQRSLAYRRGYRHGLLAAPPQPSRFAAGFLAGVRAHIEHEATQQHRAAIRELLSPIIK